MMGGNGIPALLRHKLNSYLIVTGFGITGGLLVAFFSRFSSETLWAFSLFSSVSIGFWMTTTSIIVLASEKPISAFINAFSYVFWMFFVTWIFKSIRLYNQGYGGDVSLRQSLPALVPQVLAYSFSPGIVCGILGLILHIGRKNSWYGKVLLIMPLIVITAEMITKYLRVFIDKRDLFMALVDSGCAIVYILIFRKAILLRLPRKSRGQLVK